MRVLVSIDESDNNAKYPNGHMMKIIGNSNEIEIET